MRLKIMYVDVVEHACFELSAWVIFYQVLRFTFSYEWNWMYERKNVSLFYTSLLYLCVIQSNYF